MGPRLIPKTMHSSAHAKLILASVCLIALVTIALIGCTTGVTYRTPEGQSLTVTLPESSKGLEAFRAGTDERGNPYIQVSVRENFNWREMDLRFGAFRIYHIAAVITALIGALIIAFKPIPNGIGWTLIAAAAALGIFAHIVPTYGLWITIALGLACIGGVGYYLYERGFWNLNPDLKRD